MPGWWYSIESTTTKHLLAQFEQACREALSSGRSTREILRAKSSKQRFPVVEWIKKLDKLQLASMRLSGRSKRRNGQSGKLKKLKQDSGGLKGTSPNNSSQALPLAPRTLYDSLESRQESYAESILSTEGSEGHGSESPRLRPYPRRNVSNLSLKSMGDDDIIEPTELRRGIIEPPPKGSNLSRKLSLGTRLGPGHLRTRKHDSIHTIDSLGALEEEQPYPMPADDDDEYLYTADAIRRQLARNQGARRGSFSDTSDTSDQDSDIMSSTPDSGSVYEFDPQKGNDAYSTDTRRTDLMYFEDDQDGHDGFYIAQEDMEPDAHLPLQMRQTSNYAAGLDPPTSKHGSLPGSHLSLASVLGGRDNFALSHVEDTFTDADGKYVRQFASEFHKLDSKTSKDELCIEEYITKSEKEWANEVRNKKLGIEAHFGSDLKSHFTQKVPAVDNHIQDDRPMTETPAESNAEEPLFGYQRPTGVKLFLQRRIGDWPVYSFLLALVFTGKESC